MKIINIKSVLPAALLVMTASCTDLDVDIKSQYTSFPDSEQATEAVSADVYNAYRNALGRDHWLIQTISGGEAVSVAFGNDWYDGGAYREHHLHNWTPDNTMLPTIWNSAMSGITSCNKVLALLEDTESDNAAPIRAMRAFYTFILMDNFGDVPIIERMSDEQANRASRSDVCKFIETELLAVKEKLPKEVDNSTYGKATLYMAEALLAKLYLNWAVYTAADPASYTPATTNEKLNSVVEMCDNIIKSGKFNLNDKFVTKFRPDNGPHIKDFIFVVPYDREKQQGMTYSRFWIHRSAQKQFANLPQSVGGTLRCLPEFFDKFSLEGDERNATYLSGKQYYWSNYQKTDKPFTINTTKKGIDQDYTGADADEKFDWQLELTKEIILRPDGADKLDCGNDQKGRSMGYRSIKFYMDTEVTSAQARNQSNDVPILRYADVLLMKAEAILRGATATNGDTPESLINQIRDYVSAPKLSATASLNDLLDERAREFADESWRRNDLIRFGMFENKWGFRDLYPAGYTEKFRRIFPIPRTVLNVNTNWKQNPGY